ncbi:MAG: glucose 1-dehydrogenase [Calditrichae bacterium]|nr:glucose 1-dehydrogenase [Calditrichia bacterium]
MNISFQDKVLLITGATSGIGEALAAAAVRLGGRVMLTGRNSEKLAELQESLSPAPDSLAILAGDLADDAFRVRLVAETVERFGGLDVLVNNAGIIHSDTVAALDMAAYERVMNLNLGAVVHLSHLAVPHLEARKGNIVNVSSVAGTRAFPGILSYCISKAGTDQFTRCAALELAAQGIRVNAVNPGVVETRLHLNSGMEPAAYRNFLERSKQTHPIGRVGRPEEIADLILFLASDAAGWITGGCYAIDGGRAETCAR